MHRGQVTACGAGAKAVAGDLGGKRFDMAAVGIVGLITMKMVAWIEIHREDLMADWNLTANGKTPFPIKGLDQ